MAETTETQTNTGKVIAAAPARPAMDPDARAALRAAAFPETDVAPPLFSSRGVTIEKKNDGPVTLGEIRAFVAAADGMDDGLPLLIQAWTDNRNGDEYFAKIEVVDQVNLDA